MKHIFKFSFNFCVIYLAVLTSSKAEPQSATFNQYPFNFVIHDQRNSQNTLYVYLDSATVEDKPAMSGYLKNTAPSCLGYGLRDFGANFNDGGPYEKLNKLAGEIKSLGRSVEFQLSYIVADEFGGVNGIEATPKYDLVLKITSKKAGEKTLSSEYAVNTLGRSADAPCSLFDSLNRELRSSNLAYKDHHAKHITPIEEERGIDQFILDRVNYESPAVESETSVEI